MVDARSISSLSTQPRLAVMRLCLICITIVVSTVSVIAQPQTKDLSEASLEELANISVYTASRHEQKATEAPSSVTVITRDEIQEYGYRTLADILRSVRGFDVTYDRNFSYAGVRGINRPETYNSRVLLLIDGHRINNNIYEQAMLGTEFPLDVDLIERVEVVRGPSSSLYGTSAFFAVINVITRKPQELTGWELSFEPASFDTYKGRASYGGKYQGMDMVLSGDFYDSQGQSLFYPQFNTPATNNGIARHANYDTYQHFLATVSVRGFTLQGVYSDRNKGIPTGAFGTLFNDPQTHTFDSERYIDLSYQHAMGGGWELDGRTSVGRHVYDGIYAYSPAAADQSNLLNYDFARGTWWSGEVKAQRILERQTITLGTEFQENLQQDQGNYNINPFLAFIASRAPSSGIEALYGQYEVSLTHKLSLSAGFRCDHYYTFGGTTNPRLGLIYRPFSYTIFKLLYGSAFRAPSAYEMFYYGLGQYQANLHLQPETIKSYELVAEQELGKHFHLTADVFRNEVRQLITQGLNSNGFLVFQNTSGAHVTGFATELDGRFAAGLQGKASYSYTNQNALIRETLTNSPQHLAKLNVIAPLLHQKLFAGVEAQFNGPATRLDGDTVPSFQVLNATLLGHAVGRHLDVSASVYNLLDKKYFDPAPVGLTEEQIQQDGRNFRVKITARF